MLSVPYGPVSRCLFGVVRAGGPESRQLARFVITAVVVFSLSLSRSAVRVVSRFGVGRKVFGLIVSVLVVCVVP